MIEIHWRGGRPGADGPFYALLILALGLIAGLLGFIVHHSAAIAARAVDACLAVADNVTLLSGTLLLPWAVISVIVGFALVAAGWQWLATRALIHRLLSRVQPTPPNVALAAATAGLEGLDLVDDERPFAFCHGLRAPRVCVTTALIDLLSLAELEAVLRHERHHVASRDPLKILLSRSLGVGLFFLPAAQDLHERYMVGKEVAADAEAADAVQSEVPLASALLKLLSHGGATLPSSVAAIGAFNLTEERINRMVRGVPAGRAHLDVRRLVLSGVVIAFIFVASYAPLAVASASSVDECGQISLVGQ